MGGPGEAPAQTGSTVPATPAASGDITTVAPAAVRLHFVRFAGQGPTSRQSIGAEEFRYFVDGALVRTLHLYADGHVDLLLQPGHPAELELLETRVTVSSLRLASIDTERGKRTRLMALGYRVVGVDSPTQEDHDDPADHAARVYEDECALGRAVYDFQVDQGLRATGNFDDATIARLRALCEGGA